MPTGEPRVSFNHLDDEGRARMVDVRAKEVTDRVARAEAIRWCAFTFGRLLT